MEPGDDVRDVVFLHLGALVVQREAVGFHIVEPHLIGAARAGLGKHQHRCGHACVGLEHAGGHGNDRPQLVVFNQFFSDALVRLAGTEQNAVRHDAGAASAGFEHPQEERKEQKLRLFGVGDCLQVIVDALGIHSALERRVCKADGVLAANGVLLRHAVLVVDFRVRDGVEHQVHGRNAQHGAVRVKAGEHRAGKMLPLLRGHAVLVVGAEVLRAGPQKARRAAGGVADKVVRRELHQFHHHVTDVLGRAELAVLPCCCQFAQHILVQVALHIKVGNIVGVKILQPGDDLLQHLWRGNEEHGIVHVPCVPLPFEGRPQSLSRSKAVLPSSGRVGSSAISTSSPFASKSGRRPYFIFLMAGNTRCCMVRKISRESLSLKRLHRIDCPAALAGKMCSIFSPAMFSKSSVASSFSSSDRMNMR